MVQEWDPTRPGFVGDDNIYGVGIRVGYYTQAVSIWVANFYARHEAPYLHTLTILFLIAMFVGLCELCKNPTNTYAVEPFMLTSIAYYTLSLGLWDPSPPYLLPWEVEFRKRFAVMVIWLAFQGFETWYWWVGVWKMKPSDGPQGTIIFFPYVGNTPLFGPDQWISIAAKVLNAIIATILLLSAIRLSCYTVQQQRLDGMITVEQLKLLSVRWLRAFERTPSNPDESSAATLQMVAPPSLDVGGEHDSVTAKDEKKTDSVIAISPTEPDVSKSMGCNKQAVDENSSASSQDAPDSPPPYRRPTRTGTGLLKRGLLRWPTTKDVDLSSPPPDYVLYEPKFENLNAAVDLLGATTSRQKKKPPFWGANVLEIWFFLPILCFEVIHYLCTQIVRPFRPAVLLAITSHAWNLRYGRRLSYSKILRLALNHPTYSVARSKDIVLASRILLSTEKPVKPTRGWYIGIGWATLGACSVLIIATELTIQWNGIKGVQNLSSVGQLIPFTLGVGGLLKVIYSAVAERELQELGTFCYFERCSKEGKKEKWKETGDEFMKCRKAFARLQTLPTAPRKVKEAAQV